MRSPIETGQVVATGFEHVAETFWRLMASRGGGAGLAIYLDGVPVVDLWGGTTYAQDSLQLVFSATKGVTSICIATLVQDGRLEIERPVSELWPGFGAAGKHALTVGDVMSHRAGLPALEAMEPLAAWADGRVADRLAGQAPLWSRGQGHGYHPWTFGVLADALIRRVDGRSVGRYFAEEVAVPYGIDFWIGLPQELEDRVVPLVIPTDPIVVDRVDDPSDEARRVSELVRSQQMRSNYGGLEFMNSREAHEVELAAVNGIGSARGLAKLYAARVSDLGAARLMSEETVEAVTQTRSDGVDLVNLEEGRFGVGFQLSTDRFPMAGPGSFGHAGMGGCLAFAQPRLGLAFAFTTDIIPPVAGADPATTELIDAAVRCVDASNVAKGTFGEVSSDDVYNDKR